MKDDNNNKRDLLWRYSVKWTAVSAILFGGLVFFLYFFGETRYAGWVFGIVFTAIAFITLRYFYLRMRYT